MSVTEKKLVKQRFSRCYSTYNEQAVVQKEVVTKFCDLLSVYLKKDIKRVLEVGCGTGMLTELLVTDFNISELILNDLVGSDFIDVKIRLETHQFEKYGFIQGDAEKILFPSGLDAVLSASCFQWFNNIEMFIMRMSEVLNSKGILAFSTYGTYNFKEIREILNVGLDYHTLNEHKEIISKEFNIIHSEEWRQVLQFDNPNKVLRHIKDTGVNGIGYGFFGKSDLTRFTNDYKNTYGSRDSTVSLTYHPIIIIAQKKS